MSLNEPTTLKVRLHQVPVKKKVAPIKVMLTGDWHISPIVSERQYEFLKEAIAEAKPDVIILQGDLMDSPVELKRETSLKKLMKQLKLCAKAAPTLMVMGNHDYMSPIKPVKVMKDFAVPRFQILAKKCGVKLLLNEWATVSGVRFFGAFQEPESIVQKDKKGVLRYRENWKKYEKEISRYDFSGLPDDQLNWFIAHAPMLTKGTLEHLSEFDVLSFGHTHGGVVPRGLDEAMEKVGMHSGLLHPDQRIVTRYLRGAIKLKTGNTAVVNPGMVGAQFCAPKVFQDLNFVKAAEVSVVEVRPQGDEDDAQKTS